jgi:hypothetical protein
MRRPVERAREGYQGLTKADLSDALDRGDRHQLLRRPRLGARPRAPRAGPRPDPDRLRHYRVTMPGAARLGK